MPSALLKAICLQITASLLYNLDIAKKIIFLTEESDALLCHGVPGCIPGGSGSLPAAGAKFKGLLQQHLSFASSGVGTHPRAEEDCLCFFQNKGLSPGLLGALTACLLGSDQLAGLIEEAVFIDLGNPGQHSRAGCCVRRSSRCGRQRRGKMALAFLLAAVLGLLIVKAVLFQLKNLSSPPCIRSWIPWFGAAFQFGKAPLEFIEQARSKVMAVVACLLVGECSGWLPARGKVRGNFDIKFAPFLSHFVTSGAFSG